MSPFTHSGILVKSAHFPCGSAGRPQKCYLRKCKPLRVKEIADFAGGENPLSVK
jgi:hypothetical protein